MPLAGTLEVTPPTFETTSSEEVIVALNGSSVVFMLRGYLKYLAKVCKERIVILSTQIPFSRVWNLYWQATHDLGKPNWIFTHNLGCPNRLAAQNLLYPLYRY